jgi:transmembrane sensor
MKQKVIESKLITEYLFTENTKVKEMINKRIKDDEKSRRDFDAYIELWEKSADLKQLDEIDTGGDWMKVRSRLKLSSAPRRIPARLYLTRIAAILIVALGLTAILTWYLKESSNKQNFYFETFAANEVKPVVLSDGSTIHMNRNAKIIYNADYATKNRDILLEGEAFFEVARNENIPFRVHTLNSVIEVLGTSFDIKSDSNLVIVGVISGKVAFYESKNTRNRLELLPQNTGIFNAATSSLRAENSFDPNSIAWHTGLFVFRKKTMAEAFESVANTFNLKLKVEPEVKFDDTTKINFSGHSLQELVINLNLGLTNKNIEVESTADQLIIRRP